MITWITDAIATASYAELDSEIRNSSLVADVRELVDRRGNTPEALVAAVDRAAEILRRHGRVYIACDMGISRSRVVALGVLIRQGASFDEALDLVRSQTRKADINLGLLRSLLSLAGKPRVEDAADRASNLLVLGGSGFVGSHVIARLKTSFNISAPTRSEVDLLTDTIEMTRLIDTAGSRHLLFLAHPRSHHSSAALGGALQMLKNALDAAREHSLHFCYLSCLAVFSGNAKDSSAQRIVASETDRPKPLGTFSETKFLGEMMVGYYRSNYHLDATILRAPVLYGPGMAKTALIPKFIRKAQRNEPIITHKYRNSYPELELLHIDDFVSAIELLLRQQDSLALAHIGSGNSVSTRDLAELIVGLCNSRSPLFLLEIDDTVQNVRSSPSAVTSGWGWAPTIALQDGLKSLVSSYERDDEV
jgi:nucleoside-diphosphate-sugar epimerase